MSTLEISSILAGGDRRSIGRSNKVARLVLKSPRRFRELIACLWHESPVVRMRAADAAEKVSAQEPRLLDRHKPQLLGLLAEAEQIELRWHLAAMIPRLHLTPAERQRTAAALHRRRSELYRKNLRPPGTHRPRAERRRHAPQGEATSRRCPPIRHTRHACPRP